MIEVFAARRSPLQQLDRAVDGDVFLVAGNQEGDRALGLAAVGGEILQPRSDAAGDAALHVDGAPAVEEAVLYLAGKGAQRPRRFIAGRDHVGMAGEADVGAVAAAYG